MKKQEATIESAQRYAMWRAVEDLMESLGDMPKLQKYDLMGIEKYGMPGNWKSGIRPISPKYLVLFYNASKKDRRFLCTNEQKNRMASHGVSSIPSQEEWPSISEEELRHITERYGPQVPEAFRKKVEYREGKAETKRATSKATACGTQTTTRQTAYSGAKRSTGHSGEHSLWHTHPAYAHGQRRGDTPYVSTSLQKVWVHTDKDRSTTASQRTKSGTRSADRQSRHDAEGTRLHD
jgi:hypothetical protein